MRKATAEGPVIDFHVRLRPAARDRENLLATMDHHGIRRAVVCAGGILTPHHLAEQVVWGGGTDTDADNDAVLAGCRDSDGRLVPFYFANPHRDPDDYRARAAEFRGVEISPAVHGLPLFEERTVALVRVAAEFDHPVYIVPLGRSGFATGDLVALAKKFPDVTFVLGHCGFIGIDFAAVEAVAETSNIVAETSGCFTAVARTAVRRLGADRVVFGSEYPIQDPGVELAKYQALNLPPDEWHQIAWQTAHRILGDDDHVRPPTAW